MKTHQDEKCCKASSPGRWSCRNKCDGPSECYSGGSGPRSRKSGWNSVPEKRLQLVPLLRWHQTLMKTVWSSDPVMRGLSLPSTKRSSSTGHLSFKISTFSNVSSMPFQWDSRLYTDQDWISQTETFPNLSGRPFGTHLPVCGPWPEAFIWQEIPLSKKYLCRKWNAFVNIKKDLCKKKLSLSKEKNTLVKENMCIKNVSVLLFVILTVQYLCKNGNST